MPRLIFKDIWYDRCEHQKETHEYEFRVKQNDYEFTDYKMIDGLVEEFFRGLRKLGWINRRVALRFLSHLDDFISTEPDEYKKKHRDRDGCLFHTNYKDTSKKLSDLYVCFLTKEEMKEE
tara:strand:+ start:3557 stop:3916 length:360 start_codon:yes stop_codon:yes gene_type:complete